MTLWQRRYLVDLVVRHVVVAIEEFEEELCDNAVQDHEEPVKDRVELRVPVVVDGEVVAGVAYHQSWRSEREGKSARLVLVGALIANDAIARCVCELQRARETLVEVVDSHEAGLQRMMRRVEYV